MHPEVRDVPYTLALPPGELLAQRYRVIRPVGGSSAFAITYLAEDSATGADAVIKEFLPRSLVGRGADGSMVRPHSPEDERDFLRALRRFVHEGAALAEIVHPHLVRARRLLEANGTAYLVMDRQEGKPLADIVRDAGGRLAPARAGDVVQHLLSALEPLHAESIVHRALSPQSVYMLPDGRPIILGFSARRHVMAQTDLVPGFAAFEQYGTRDIGPWTDVYAAAAILYYLLTGAAPLAALDRAAGETLASPGSIVSELPPAVSLAVLRGLALLPEQRPHSASEFRRQLEAVLGEAAHVPQRNASHGPFAREDAVMAADQRYDERDGRGGSSPNLAASGFVVPNEERPMARLVRRLGDMFAGMRQRPAPVVQPSLMDFARDLPRAAAPRVRREPEGADVPVPRRPAVESVPPSPALIIDQTPPPAPAAPDASKPNEEQLKAEPTAPVSPVPVPKTERVEEFVQPLTAKADVESAAPSVVTPPVAPVAATVAAVIEPLSSPPLRATVRVKDTTAAEPTAAPSEKQLDVAPVVEPAVKTPDRSKDRDVDIDTESSPVIIASRRNRRPILIAAAALLSVGAGTAALLMRDGGLRAQGVRRDLAAARDAEHVTAPAPIAPTPAPSHENASAPVVQGDARLNGGHRLAAADSISTPARFTNATRGASSAAASAAVTTPRPVPSSGAPSGSAVPNLAPLNVTIQTGLPELKMVPPELLVDARARLASGTEQADLGEYRAARRIFRTALQQLDSATARYPESQALRGLRREVEQADQGALRACIAENELHRKRGEQPGSCQ